MKSMLKIVLSLWWIAGALLMAGCSSNKTFAGMADFTGCVCTTNGKGIDGYVIQCNGQKTVTSPSGMFLFEDLESGPVELTGGKQGFCSIKKAVAFDDRRKVYFIQVQSMDEVYDRVEELVKAGELNLAEKLLANEKLFNGGSRVFKFYEKLIAFKKGDSAAGDEMLRLCGGEL